MLGAEEQGQKPKGGRSVVMEAITEEANLRAGSGWRAPVFLASKFLLRGYTPQVGDSWYTDNTCSRLCSCSTYNNVSCLQTSCKPGQMCRPLDGLIRC